MNIGEKIRQLRKWRGMSQEKLGEALNMTAQNVSSLELGRTKPSPEMLKTIAKSFGVGIDYFYEDEDTAAWYVDALAASTAQELFENPELRILFDAARDSRPEDLRMAADLLKRLKKTNPD